MADKPATLIDLLQHAADAHGQDAALSVKHGLRTECWTYRELGQRVAALANHFANGTALKPGARIMICTANGPWTVAAHLGAMQAGLIVVPLDVGSSPDFIMRVAQKTEARLLIGGPGTPRPDGIPFIDLLTMKLAEHSSWNGRTPAADDIAQIVFTSGTTGDPKGSVLSHGNIVANVLSASAIVPENVPLHMVSILPLSHMLEQTVGLYLPILGGGSVHYASSLQPTRLLQELRRRQPTGMVVVPRFLEMMMKAIEQKVRERNQWAHWERLHKIAAALPIGLRPHLFARLHRQLGGRLRFFLCGGASLPPDLARRWENTGIRIIEGYGSTECAPVIASNTYHDRQPGTVGRPIAGVGMKLSEEGEIWVRGANVSRGYWQDPERTALAFTADGWFRTGDVAEIADGGVYRIVARLNDRIVLPSGQKIYPADVEEQLRKENGVLDCVVVSLPDGRGREHVHAILRVEEDQDTEGIARSAIRNANGRLGSHQQVLGHTIWKQGEFPHTQLGKIKRNELRSTLLAARPANTIQMEGVSSLTGADDVAERLRALLKEIVRPPQRQATPGSDLGDDLNLDSLGLIELASAIEAQLGVPLEESQLAAVRTVSDLEKLVMSGSKTVQQEEFPSWQLTSLASGMRGILQSGLMLPAHAALCKPFEVEGAEHLAGLSGPLLLVANHSSHIDTLSVLKALPRHLRRKTAIAAASDYFYRSHWGGAFTSLVLNTFPFSRAGNIRASLERCGELVDDGWSILIYPEGTRSPDGTLLPFKSGIGLLAKGLHIPVVPIAVDGGFAILPKGARFPRRGPARVRFGPPVDVDPLAGTEHVTLALHDAVASLISKR